MIGLLTLHLMVRLLSCFLSKMRSEMLLAGPTSLLLLGRSPLKAPSATGQFHFAVEELTLRRPTVGRMTWSHELSG